MSLVIQYHQETKEFKRLIYVPNNISEIIDSHGITFLDCQKEYYKTHKTMLEPYDMLPDNYENLSRHEQNNKYMIAMWEQEQSELEKAIRKLEVVKK